MTLSVSTDFALFAGVFLGTFFGIIVMWTLAGSLMRVIDRLFLLEGDE